MKRLAVSLGANQAVHQAEGQTLVRIEADGSAQNGALGVKIQDLLVVLCEGPEGIEFPAAGLSLDAGQEHFSGFVELAPGAQAIRQVDGKGHIGRLQLQPRAEQFLGAVHTAGLAVEADRFGDRFPGAGFGEKAGIAPTGRVQSRKSLMYWSDPWLLKAEIEEIAQCRRERRRFSGRRS